MEPGTVFSDCDGCPEMVVIPAGSFMMGSTDEELELQAEKAARLGFPTIGIKRTMRNEQPQHKVQIAYTLGVSRHEITRGEFAKFVTATKHQHKGGCFVKDGHRRWRLSQEANWQSPGFDQTDDHPVVCINIRIAQEYAKWLSSETGKVYRLLTEAEQEYVIRGGTTSLYSWGDNFSKDQANYYAREKCCNGNIFDEDDWINTRPVGSYSPNPFGLYDVHGNVAELTQDCWNGNYDSAPSDGSAEREGSCTKGVVRGGSWVNVPFEMRSAGRFLIRRNHFPYSAIGFRIAREIAQ